MAVPTFTRYTQLPIQVQHRWDAEWTIAQALEDLKIGRFAEPALLADAILTDDRVRGVFDTRVNGMLGLGMDFEDESEDDQNDDELSPARQAFTELVEASLDQILPEEEVSEFIQKALLTGIQVGELVWTRRDGLWMPRLKTWDDQFLFWVWNPDQRPDQMFWLITAEGTINITPGDGHWVLFAPHGFYYGWRRGLLRNISRLWLDRAYALRDWARRSERNGLGITIGETPQVANQKDKAKFIAGLQRMASEPTIIAPSGLGPNGDQKFDVRMVDTKEGEISQFYAEHFKELNSDIAICVLGQDLTTQGKSTGLGSAQAHVHENVRRDFLRFDARVWCRFTEEQIFRPMADINTGNKALSPRPIINVDPPEDIAQTATGLQSLGAALLAFKTAGAPVDQRKLLEDQDVPTTADDPAPAPAPGGPPAPGAAPQPGSPQPPKPQPQPVEHTTALSAAPRRPRHGGRKGQRYLDDLATKARELAAKAIRPELEVLMAAVNDATSLQDVKHRVLAAYAGMPSSRLQHLVEKALLLAKLSGRKAVLEDL